MNPEDALAGIAQEAWWKSKKMVVVIGHHLVILFVEVFTLIHDPSSAATVIPAGIASHTAVTLGHNAAQAATDRAQAYSPNYPMPPTPVQTPMVIRPVLPLSNPIPPQQ